MGGVLSADDVAGVTRRPEEARSLPAQIFYAPEVYEFERKVIFRKGWMAVGFGMQVPTPGSILPVTFAGYELLLVRDQDGQVRCFHNLCRHRGMKLATAPARDQKKITCGYHCWTYSLKGKLVATPHINGRNVNDHDGLDKSKLGLLEIRTGMWFDMIFVNLDGNAKPLEEHLAPLRRRVAPEDLASVRPSGDVAVYPRGGNWKIVIEAGIEDYHLPFVQRRRRLSGLLLHLGGRCAQDAARSVGIFERRTCGGLAPTAVLRGEGDGGSSPGIPAADGSAHDVRQRDPADDAQSRIY
jgi:choline monooxygenase